MAEVMLVAEVVTGSSSGNFARRSISLSEGTPSFPPNSLSLEP